MGSLYLHNFVDNPFQENASFNYNKLIETVNIAVRFLDNIIDKNNYPLKMFEDYQKNMRTIGLGITGLGDALAMMGMKYGSDEALELTDKIMHTITYHAYSESIELAKEKGPFPFLDREAFIQSGYMQKMLHESDSSLWEEIIDKIRKYGIRNARMIVIAPAGTMSMTFGNNCSSGIEPIFSLEYDRKVHIGGQDDKDVQIVKFRDYAYEMYKNLGSPKIKDGVFTTALELSVKEHIDMLEVVAFYSDSSISKTINIPEQYSFEDTKEVYMKCWKSGIKGCTIFRPNPIRMGILIDPNAKPQEEQKTSINYNTISPIEKEEIGTTYGTNVKKITSCGKLHINVARNSRGDIVELFVNGSKGGICTANVSAISRLVSLALRSGVKVEEIADQLRGIDCKACSAAKARGTALDGISCPDIIGRTIQENYYEGPYWLKDADEIKVTKKKENNFPKENTCPQCGEQLAHNDGCVICMGCGYSKCG